MVRIFMDVGGLRCCNLESLLPPLSLPPPREVHFWCLFPEEVKDPSLLTSYTALLSPEEQKQASQLNTLKHQHKEHLLSRTLARTLLSRYAGGPVSPNSLKFQRNKFGKPEILWPKRTMTGETWQPPKLQFNLSHTSSLLACGVTSNSMVGIDVEEKERVLRNNVMAFARRKFSKVEATWLEHFANHKERHHRFMQLWTLKESYVKALGNGIRGSALRDFSFRLEPAPAIHRLLERATQLPAHEQALSISLEILNSELPHSGMWQFLLFEPTDVHYASVCVENCKEIIQEGETDTNEFRVKIMKTIPFVGDELLCKNALGLGLSM